MDSGRQLDLKRHALEVLIEMFDPVFRLLTIQRWHQCCDRIRAARRAPHPVCGAIKNNVANLDVHDTDALNLAKMPRAGAMSTMQDLGTIPWPHSDSLNGGPISLACTTSRVVSEVTPAAQ